jgi:hypothetical protein
LIEIKDSKTRNTVRFVAAMNHSDWMIVRPPMVEDFCAALQVDGENELVRAPAQALVSMQHYGIRRVG